MSSWGASVRALAVGAALLAACSEDEPSASTTTTSEAPTTTVEPTTTTAPERPASTTTTAFDPTTVEGEVEAAYLKSWDVYADAVYNLELDEAALAEVFADEHLQTKIEEIQGRIRDGRAAHVRVQHDYEITILDAGTAVIGDEIVNHQVLIDPKTKVPVEPDPNEVIATLVTLRHIDGSWKVTRKEQVGGEG